MFSMNSEISHGSSVGHALMGPWTLRVRGSPTSQISRGAQGLSVLDVNTPSPKPWV